MTTTTHAFFWLLRGGQVSISQRMLCRPHESLQRDKDVSYIEMTNFFPLRVTADGRAQLYYHPTVDETYLTSPLCPECELRLRLIETNDLPRDELVVTHLERLLAPEHVAEPDEPASKSEQR